MSFRIHRAGKPSWVKVSLQTVKKVPILILIGAIRVYQAVASPVLGPTCKYYPVCSQYAVIALRRHGVIRGLGLALWRLLRCNPWSLGGVDDVPPARVRRHTSKNGVVPAART